MLLTQPLRKVVVSGGSETIVEKDINFYTPYGDLVASYEVSDLPLSALPDAPELDRLTFQEWNYTLAQVNATNYKLDVGGTYKTTSGYTELDITLTTATGLDVYFQITKDDTETMTVNWGDTSSDTSSSSGVVVFSHTYSSAGDYRIDIECSTGTYRVGGSTYSKNWFDDGSTTFNNYVTGVRLSEYVSYIKSGCFKYMYNCEHITIPEETSLGGARDVANYNFSLKILIMPSNGVAGLDYLLYNTNAKIIFSSDLTSFGSSYMIGGGGLKQIKTITIPAGITSISSRAFYNVYNCLVYDFSRHTSVPTLAAVDAFNGINELCKIYVPASLEATWKAATNWSAYADYIVGV